jgi:hypothetical protein
MAKHRYMKETAEGAFSPLDAEAFGGSKTGSGTPQVTSVPKTGFQGARSLVKRARLDFSGPEETSSALDWNSARSI